MTSTRIVCPELIGRDDVLAKLDAWSSGSAAGAGRTVLIAGDAGIGKTALLRAFVERNQTTGARILIGDCSEAEAQRPFGPFVEMLRSALHALPAAVVQQSLRERAVELLRFLPELAQGKTTADPSAPGERYRIHESFAAFFADLAGRAPLMLAAEDLHWADPGTLELVPYLARKLRRKRVLLLVTYRSDELHRLHPLRHVLAELARGRLADELTLGGLTDDETGQVIQATFKLQRPPTAGFRRAISERCAGNPFFIEEVLKALVERGDLAYRDGAWERDKDVGALAIPESVRDAVEQRLKVLTPETRRVLRIAAVIGGRFGFELLQKLSELTESRVLAALHEAIDAQLVAEETGPGSQESYAFHHALTRETVLGELLQRERRLLHGAVGEAIESRAGADRTHDAESLAYHFDEAADAERALRYHDLAAGDSMHVFAFARAAQHLERVLTLAPHDDRVLGDLQLRLAEAAYLSDDIQRALHAAERARASFEQARDPRRSAAALIRVTECLLQIGDLPAAELAATSAIRSLDGLGNTVELATAYSKLARVRGRASNFVDAIAPAEQAIAIATEVRAARVVAEARVTLAGGLATQGRIESIALAKEGIALALEHGFVEEAQQSYNQFYVMTWLLGVPIEERRQIHRDATEHSRRFGHRPAMQIDNEAWAAFNDGSWDDVLRLEEELSGGIRHARVRMLVALILAARDGPEQGTALARESRETLLAHGEPQYAAVAAESALITWLAGDPVGTLHQAEVVAQNIARDTSPGLIARRGSAPVVALLAAEKLGDQATTARWRKLLTPEREVEPLSGTALRAFARAGEAVDAGDLGRAIDLLAQSVLAWEREWMGPFPIVLSRLRRAELLLLRAGPDDPVAAAAELAAVVPYWRKAKATWYLGQLRAWAAQHGLRFPQEPASAAATTSGESSSPLSSREREVAALVAEGLTNRQIAEKLVISERTAEGHVEQIRNKLGFHSRTQIATWVAQGSAHRSS
jgi:DNA-binding CsgD family transcriptional regulator/tetratricopeptide (TPR) repeat protein